LFKSSDGALTWKATSLATDGFALISAVVFDLRNSNTVYAAVEVPWYAPAVGPNAGSSGTGVWKTTDGGISWRNLLSSTPVNVYSVLVDPQNSSSVYAATDAGIMGSSDGGESWMLIPGSPAFTRVLALDSHSPGILYGGGLGGFFSVPFCHGGGSAAVSAPSDQAAEAPYRHRSADCLR
jgi:hypothetical protein